MDRRVTLLLFLSLLFSGAKASVVSLSLKESEQRFSEHNLEVIAERYNIDIAEAQVVQAKLFENPVVSLEQNVYNRLNGRYFDFGKQGETIVEVEQLIYIAGQRNKRVRLEKINKEMALYQFSVTDTGCGIPLEKQPTIFNRFERVDEKSQGTGIGLSICQFIIDQLGGNIWIDPEYTNGSRFIFTHPLKQAGKA